jgi:energy-coupling factor transport system permease protein
MRRSRLALDPRTKLFLIAVTSVVVFVAPYTAYTMALMGLYCLLFALGGRLSSALRLVACYLAIAALRAFVVPVVPAQVGVMLSVIGYVGIVFPCAMAAAFLVDTTSVGELAAALRALRSPETLTVALVATLRFFPAIGREAAHVRDAMRLRSVRGWGRKLECLYVPLLLSIASTATDLGSSVAVRGIENPGPRSSWHEIGMGSADALAMAAFSAVLVLAVASRVAVA